MGKRSSVTAPNAVLLYAPCSPQLVTQCSSQSGTLILGNKPIILRESYRQRLLSLCVMILVTLSKETLSLELNIVIKNKSKVVQRCLYSYRHRYSPSQWSKFVVDSTCFASWVHNILTIQYNTIQYILNWPLPIGAFQGQWNTTATSVKNPNWPEAN